MGNTELSKRFHMLYNHPKMDKDTLAFLESIDFSPWLFYEKRNNNPYWLVYSSTAGIVHLKIWFYILANGTVWVFDNKWNVDMYPARWEGRELHKYKTLYALSRKPIRSVRFHWWYTSKPESPSIIRYDMKVYLATSTYVDKFQLRWYSFELTYRPMTRKNVIRFNIEHHTDDEYEHLQEGVNEYLTWMILLNKMLKVSPRIWR